MNILERISLNVLIQLAVWSSQMNYLDVYFSRVNYFGDNPQDRVKNNGMLAFEKWLASSPCTVQCLSVERGIYFSGIIETNKDRDEKKLMELHVANDIPIVVGDILNWYQDNGELTKWILLSTEQKVHGPYQSFSIIKCNYEIKWINAQGRLLKSWSYVCSSTDDKIKGNFRTWHNLITPQPNKYAEIIMPRVEVDRGTNFIIEDEGWQMVESDFTSVKGIIYMSLTESKVNYEYDDRDIDVADTDKLKFPILNPLYTVGDYLIPDFGENTFNEWEIELLPSEETDIIRQNSDGLWQAIAPGKVLIIMRLKDRRAVTRQFELTIKAPEAEFSAYIDGADKVKLDRYQEYYLTDQDGNAVDIDATIIDPNDNIFSLDSTYDKLASIEPARNNNGEFLANKCILHANNKNKIGEIILCATYNSQDYSKIIKIVPLW